MVQLVGVSVSTGTGTSITTPEPPGVQAGDALFWCQSNQNATPLPLPSGWDAEVEGDAGTALAGAVFRRLAPASRPGSYTSTGTPNGKSACVMVALRDFDPALFDVATPVALSNFNAAAEPIVLPGITTATDGAWVCGIAIGCTASGVGRLDFTGTNADSLDVQSQSDAGGANVGVAFVHEVMTAAGSFTPTVSTNVNPNRHVGITIAIKPAAAGGTEDLSGGGSTSTITSATGAGDASESAEAGSTSVAQVQATGSGVGGEVSEAGSIATIQTDAIGSGSGSEDASGGQSTSIATIATGSGTGTEQGSVGADSVVSIQATGSGTGVEEASGGGTATVGIVATGGGQGSTSGGGTENLASGGTASVGIGAVGAGSGSETSGIGASPTIVIAADTGKVVTESAQAGSAAAVAALPVGAGFGAEVVAVGSTITVPVVASGFGSGLEWAGTGGSSLIQVLATGGGEGEGGLEPPTMINPIAVLVTPSKHRLTIVSPTGEAHIVSNNGKAHLL